jgi:hypothetical protein
MFGLLKLHSAKDHGAGQGKPQDKDKPQGKAKPQDKPAAKPKPQKSMNDLDPGARGAPPFGGGEHGPQAPGGPAGAEFNPDPPRPKEEDGFSPPDTKRGWKGA